MVKKCFVIILSAFLGILFSGEVVAQHSHDHGGMKAPAEKKSSPQRTPAEKAPVQFITVEGLKISFEVMAMGEHMQHLQSAKGAASPHSDAAHSQSHSIMVTIQDMAFQEIISDAKVAFLILSPQGEKETGKLEWSGDHYGGGFSLKEKGVYQVQLKVESGGMEREATFRYEAK
jgi:hypothetical protein